MHFYCKVWLVLSVTIIFYNITFASIGHTDYENESILSPCVLKLCEKYLKSEKAMKGSLVVLNVIHKPNLFQRRILEKLHDDKNHLMSLMVKNANKIHSPLFTTDKAQNYIVLLAHSSELAITIVKMVSRMTWNPLAQFLVIYTEPMKSIYDREIAVQFVLNEFLQINVLNVNVIVQSIEITNQLDVFTWFPYHNESCAHIIENVKKIEECKVIERNENGIVIRRNLIKSFNQQFYPRIPKTLHECPLKITTFINEPYVVGRKNKLDKGLEILMVKVISEKMNLKPIYDVIEQQRASKLITDNNKTGIYSNLLQKSSDIMVGGLYENVVSRKLLSASIAYHQDDLTWCITQAGLAPTWLNVFVIFNKFTWLAIAIAMVVTSIVLWIFVLKENKYKENIVWASLVILSLSTFQYGHYWPRKFYIKIFMATLIFYGLHINTAYHSYLISVLTRPRYEAQISTVENAKKDFHLLSKFNELIRIILESGLLSKWHKDSEKSGGFNEEDSEENKVQNTHKNIQIKLKMVHVEGAFFLCGIGLLSAVFAFIVEKISFYLKFKTKVKKANVVIKPLTKPISK
ncbi:unnamed protein product [Diamesa serratosioi]